MARPLNLLAMHRSPASVDDRSNTSSYMSLLLICQYKPSLEREGILVRTLCAGSASFLRPITSRRSRSGFHSSESKQEDVIISRKIERRPRQQTLRVLLAD